MLLIRFLGKTKADIQLKVKAMEIEKSSPAFIKIKPGRVAKIHCSAYGNGRNISGKITRAGSAVHFHDEITRSPNFISVKAFVKEEGTYLCTIKNNKSEKQVEAVTRVEIGKLLRYKYTLAQEAKFGLNSPQLFEVILLRLRDRQQKNKISHIKPKFYFSFCQTC